MDDFHGWINMMGTLAISASVLVCMVLFCVFLLLVIKIKEKW